MRNLRSSSSSNSHSTVLEQADQVTEDMQTFCKKIGPHLNECQQAFASNSNHSTDLLQLYRDHKTYIRSLETLIDTHQRVLSKVRLSHQENYLTPEFFNVADECKEILTDMTITQGLFPTFVTPKP